MFCCQDSVLSVLRLCGETSVSAEGPLDGHSQLLVPQAVDHRVQERSQSRVQHRHDDTHLQQ